MELQQFIKDLLYRYDCVIIPGFGGFVANYHPAEVNYLTHTFSPPSKDIVFNAELKDNDGLLIGHISKSSGMSYVDARKWLDKQVKELVRKLEKGKKVYLEDIGTFHLGKDKNILFEPAKSVNFLTEAYGLSDFQFSPLEVFAKQKKEKRETVHPGMSKTWRWVAVAVPLVAVLTLIPLKTNWLDSIHLDLSSLNPFHKNEQVVKPGTNVHQEINLNTTETGKAVENKQPEMPSDVTEEQPAGNMEQAAEEPVIPKVRYYIVAGSFKYRGNAEVMKNRLAGEGINATIMEGPGGFYRVAYGEFSDKTRAEMELLTVRRQKGHESYWIVRK